MKLVNLTCNLIFQKVKRNEIGQPNSHTLIDV